MIEGYKEGEGGIDELRDYDGITVTSGGQVKQWSLRFRIDPDKVDFGDNKNSELGRNLQNDKTYS